MLNHTYTCFALALTVLAVQLSSALQEVKVTIKTEDLRVLLQSTAPEIRIISPAQENFYQIYTATAYTAGVESTNKTPDHPQYGITASGQPVKERHTLSCPPSLPFNTKIFIPAFSQVYTCTDRGSAITEGRLDIYMSDLDTALSFGRQSLKVFVIPEEE